MLALAAGQVAGDVENVERDRTLALALQRVYRLHNRAQVSKVTRGLSGNGLHTARGPQRNARQLVLGFAGHVGKPLGASRHSLAGAALGVASV